MSIPAEIAATCGARNPVVKVTILTAVYNALDGLKATVESVRAQSFRDVEHVIVDGGSTDGTRDYLAGLDDAVRWISEPDEGIADALNKGLAMGRGEWVLVLHAEDTFIDQDSLAGAVPQLENGFDIVSFSVLFTRNSGARVWASRGLSSKLAFKTTIPHQGAFCRRDLFKRLGRFDAAFRITMDYDFFFRARRAGASARIVHSVLSRMPDTGISSRLDWPGLCARFDEERRVQLKYCPGLGMRTVYAVYWPLYLAYRRLKTLLPGRAFSESDDSR